MLSMTHSSATRSGSAEALCSWKALLNRRMTSVGSGADMGGSCPGRGHCAIPRREWHETTSSATTSADDLGRADPIRERAAALAQLATVEPAGARVAGRDDAEASELHGAGSLQARAHDGGPHRRI